MKYKIIFFYLTLSTLGFSQTNFLRISFENQYEMDHLFIDTVSNINNIWQVGEPQKSFVTNIPDGINVIITDTVNSYPINDTSIFIINNLPAPYPEMIVLRGYYKVNSDTITDYGKIEFSPNNGNTWIDLINDTILVDTINNLTWFWPNDVPNQRKPILSGNSQGQLYDHFYVNLELLRGFYNIQSTDTVLYKFTFISDNIETNKGGLFFDYLTFEEYVGGVTEQNNSSLNSACFPNPAKNTINISFDNFNSLLYQVYIYDLFGTLVYTYETNSNTKNISINKFENGIYLYRIMNKNNELYSTGKFIKD